MSPPLEIELKLDVPSRNLQRLTASSLLKAAIKSAAKPLNLVSVYFDTDKLQLHQRGLSLRVRRKAGNQRKRGSVCSRRMGTQHPYETTQPRRSAWHGACVFAEQEQEAAARSEARIRNARSAKGSPDPKRPERGRAQHRQRKGRSGPEILPAL
jgi:hypothetical protein